MIDTAELKRLVEASTPGPWQLMAGDPLAVDAHQAVYFAKMTGATPVTRLANNAALIVAAVNALPALLARVEELEGALGSIANSPTDGSGCNPTEFVRRARAALKGGA